MICRQSEKNSKADIIITNHEQKTINVIINHLRGEVPNLVAIYLYGSWSTEYECPDSDVDIAVLTDRSIDVFKRIDITQTLAGKLSKDVDLVDLKATTSVMQVQIVTKGTRIYCADLKYCECFENFVFSSYARLNEERSGILEDIRKRGSVYG